MAQGAALHQHRAGISIAAVGHDVMRVVDPEDAARRLRPLTELAAEPGNLPSQTADREGHSGGSVIALR